MVLSANIVKVSVFLGALILLLAGVSFSGWPFFGDLVGQYIPRFRKKPTWRGLQIRDHKMVLLTSEEVYVVDRLNQPLFPGCDGIFKVLVGPVTVFSAIDGKVLKVVDIPEDGANPYQLVLIGFVKSATSTD